MAPGSGTRPLGDRVKQALFGALEPMLPGAIVLDLFAGSGAAGIEALSRGASSAVFVEKDPAAARVIADNLRRTGLAGSTATVVRANAATWVDDPSGGPFRIVIVDPPYADTELLATVLARLGAASFPLASDAAIVAKHFWRDEPPARIGLLASGRVRRFGETALTFYRRIDGPEEVPEA